MNFGFFVGEQEKHKVEFRFNKAFGQVEVRVDDLPIPVADIPHWSHKRTFEYGFAVGDMEKHQVLIRIVRPLWVAGLRGGWKYTVFTDQAEGETHVD